MYIQDTNKYFESFKKVILEDLNENGIDVEEYDFKDNHTFKVYEVNNEENNRITIWYNIRNWGKLTEPDYHYIPKEYIKEYTTPCYIKSSFASTNFHTMEEMIFFFKNLIKGVD